MCLRITESVQVEIAIRASLFTLRLSARVSQRQEGTNNAEVTRGDNKLVISQQEAASGSNIDIVTRC